MRFAEIEMSDEEVRELIGGADPPFSGDLDELVRLWQIAYCRGADRMVTLCHREAIIRDMGLVGM